MVDQVMKRLVSMFFEGLLEPVFATMFIVIISSFLNIIQKIPNGAPIAENLLIYFFVIIFISFIANIIKGLIASTESLVSIIGMFVGVYIFIIIFIALHQMLY